MTDKDYRRLQILAEAALQKQKAVELFLEKSKEEIRICPRIALFVDNIFAVQDALGGEIEYTDWWADKFCVGHLTVNGVAYEQHGLTQDMIDHRLGFLEVWNG